MAGEKVISGVAAAVPAWNWVTWLILGIGLVARVWGLDFSRRRAWIGPGSWLFGGLQRPLAH